MGHAQLHQPQLRQAPPTKHRVQMRVEPERLPTFLLVSVAAFRNDQVTFAHRFGHPVASVLNQLPLAALPGLA